MRATRCGSEQWEEVAEVRALHVGPELVFGEAHGVRGGAGLAPGKMFHV
jgi:hypothetical protein